MLNPSGSRARCAPLLAAGLAVLASACAAPPEDGPPPFQSPYAPSGEIKIGRFSRTLDPQRNEVSLYAVFLSNTWRDRRGATVSDDFGKIAAPATAPTEDVILAALLERFTRHGFFSLPRRASVRKEDIVPGRRCYALLVETDQVRAIVFKSDCSGPAEALAFSRCYMDFEQLAAAHTPILQGVAVEKRRTFLESVLQNPGRLRVEEPKPTVELKRPKRIPPKIPVEPDGSEVPPPPETPKPPAPAEPQAPSNKEGPPAPGKQGNGLPN